MTFRSIFCILLNSAFRLLCFGMICLHFLQKAVKIAFEQMVLNNSVFFIFCFGMKLCFFRADLSGTDQNLIPVEFQEPVQPDGLVLHAHRNMTFCLKFRIVQISVYLSATFILNCYSKRH